MTGYYVRVQTCAVHERDTFGDQSVMPECGIRTMRVLVVDDFPNAAQASCFLLELLGHECKLAVSGEDALAVAASFHPDIILLDLELPGRSGFDIAREIRAAEKNGAHVFLAALTGLQFTEQNSTAAGFDVHLTKPASAEKLV